MRGVAIARLAWLNVRRRPSRTLAAATSVAVGVAAVLATLSLGDNVQANLTAELQRSALGSDVRVVAAAGERTVFQSDAAVALLASETVVRQVTTRLEVLAEPQDPAMENTAVRLPGFDSGFTLVGLARNRHEGSVGALAEGRWPAVGANEVALTRSFASARGFAVGEALSFGTPYGPLGLTVVGVLEDGQGVSALNQGRVGMVERETLTEGLGLAGRATQLDVTLVDPTESAVEAALTRFDGRLPANLMALRATAPAGGSGGLLQTLEAGLQVLAVMLVVLGSFMAYNTFAASALDRRHELRLLRTVCFAARDVRALALWEAAITAGAGVALGVILGLLLTWLLASLNALVLGFTVSTLSVSPAAVVMAALAGVLAGLVAAWKPARDAAFDAPLGVTPSPGARPAAHRGVRVLVGAGVGLTAAVLPVSGWPALLAAGVALVALAVTLVIGGQHAVGPLTALLRHRPANRTTERQLLAGFVERNAERNGVAMATVAVGVGLVLGVAGMITSINAEVRHWVDATIAGDLFVTSPSGFPAEFGAQSEAIPGVAEASPVAVRVVRADAEATRPRSVSAVFVEPERYQLAQNLGGFVTPDGRGDTAALARDLAAGDVLVSEVLGRRMDLQTGSTLMLRTLSGVEPFRVAGTVVDFTAGGDSLVVGYSALERFGGGRPNVFVIGLDADVSAGDARTWLRDAFPDTQLVATSSEQYRASIVAAVNSSFAATQSLLVLAMLLAGLGVANALAMNLNVRAHEWAVLRALGMTRARAVRLAAAEGMLITLVGIVFGSAFGLLLSRLVAQGASAITGFALTPAVPLGTLVWLWFGAIPLGVLASVWPAVRVTRLAPAQAFDAEGLKG